MNKILSRISGPLLVGSILALGALALPVPADAADGPLFIFRASSGVLPMTVADNGTGGTGGGSETSPGGGETGSGDGSGDGGEAGSGGDDTTPREPENWLVQRFEGGIALECRTTWTQDFVDAHPVLLQWDGSPNLMRLTVNGEFPDGLGGGAFYPQATADFSTGWFNFRWSSSDTFNPGKPTSPTTWNRALDVWLADIPEFARPEPYEAAYGSPCIGNTAQLVGSLPVIPEPGSVPVDDDDYRLLTSIAVEAR